MNGFERRKMQKRESIMQAALELFRERGFRHVSVMDVAARAGASQVSIYNHFQGRAWLVREVIMKFMLDMLDDTEALFRSDRPFAEKLESFIFRKEQVATQFNGELMGPATYGDRQLMQFVDQVFKKRSRELILDLVRDGKRQGAISQDISDESVLLYFDLLNRGMQAATGDLARIRFTPRLVREINSLVLKGLNG